MKILKKSSPIDKKTKLYVSEALQDDAYKGVARIDSETMKKLNLERGDIISIKGGKKSFLIVDRGFPDDEGEKLIRMDNISRKNVRAKIGEPVNISKVEVKEAKEIIICPNTPGVLVQGDPDSLRKGLLGRTLVKGDIVVLGGVKRRKDLFSEMGLGEEFKELWGDSFENKEFEGNWEEQMRQVKFKVIGITPNKPIIITENTQVVLEERLRIDSEEELPQNKIINISKLPNMENYLQLKEFKDLFKIISETDFINKFEDSQKTIYFAANYFLEIKKKK